MEYLFLKPTKNLDVHFPASKRQLKKQGERVEKSTYWLRRLKEGDVEIYLPDTLVKAEITEEQKHDNFI